MKGIDQRAIRIAILDLYDGVPNQGMRCIRQIIREWVETKNISIETKEFNVRQLNEIPDTSFDIYISSGGPGDPLTTRFEDWDIAWCKWLREIERWNENPDTIHKKHVFFICHSFQLASRYFNAGILRPRRSTAFGIFPVHMLEDGKNENTFQGLKDPFYAVDSRDHQLVQPNLDMLKKTGAKILCIEKERPHVPYERAVMAIRFNDYMIGTQFHPEADAEGMSLYLKTDEKRETIIANYGEEKFHSMIEHLQDPDKILWTYSHVLPNFLNNALSSLESQ